MGCLGRGEEKEMEKGKPKKKKKKKKKTEKKGSAFRRGKRWDKKVKGRGEMWFGR